MRIILEKKSLNILRKTVLTKNSISTLAEQCCVSRNTIKSWLFKTGSIPSSGFNKLLVLSCISPNQLIYKEVSDYWYIPKASKLGGIARNIKYGNFGTEEGRRLGGIKSIRIQKLRVSRFKTLKKIKKPVENTDLAELIGVMMGDGHLGKYQASFTTNSDTDYEHALFVASLFKRLFSVKTVISKRKNERAVDIVVSSATLVIFINKYGMPIGNKLGSGLKVPSWVKTKLSFCRSFIRGLFDTDGCVYIDRHKYKNKVYSHLGWSFTSYDVKFLNEIKSMLEVLGFRPTLTAKQKSVYLRRQIDVRKYFDIIGTSNPKHKNRFLRL